MYLYFWSIVVCGREFMVSVRHDGSMRWEEPGLPPVQEEIDLLVIL